MRAVFTFNETFFPPIQSFKILNSKVLPADMSERVMKAIEKFHVGQPTGLAVLTTVRNEIEHWYLDRGFAYCQLGSFDGLDTGNITLTVSEPKIRNVIVRYVDDQMVEKEDGGHTPVDLVLRTVSLRPGQYYSQFDGRKALQEAFTLQVCANFCQCCFKNVHACDIPADCTRPQLCTMHTCIQQEMSPSPPQVAGF
jgi:outer membrane protein assembly factor BamA